MLTMFSYLLTATLRSGASIAYTAVGGVLSEKSGVINIGLEGIMTASAFAAVVGSYLTGSPWIGVLFAILVGIAISAVHAVICITCGGNQSVSSMALILLATGFSGIATKAIFGQQGTTQQVVNISRFPLLEDIPVIGPALASLSPLVYLSVIVMLFFHYIFKKTKLGLHITMVGEHPKAAETAGINVHKVRYICVILSGVLGGLGGATLSIGQMDLFQEGMVAGRGYLAMAAVIMGGWTPLGAYGASMFFGFFSALQVYLQTKQGSGVPIEFIQMIPYIACVLIMIYSSRKRKNNGVTCSGKPYTKFVQSR
ncbi:MAG: ABC transporter permease [Bacillota bacterium]|nr:ABC transporter permease [Bacillota bacterium]